MEMLYYTKVLQLYFRLCFSSQQEMQDQRDYELALRLAAVSIHTFTERPRVTGFPL